jgi:16S rRNA C1402 N4-methylase RsmH
MRDHSRVAQQYRGLPDVPPQFRPALALVGKPRSANDDEVRENLRARSARLRVAERQ